MGVKSLRREFSRDNMTFKLQSAGELRARKRYYTFIVQQALPPSAVAVDSA